MIEHLPHELQYGDKQADKGLAVMENQEMQGGEGFASFQRVTVDGNRGSACSAGWCFVREIQAFVGRIAEHLRSHLLHFL